MLKKIKVKLHIRQMQVTDLEAIMQIKNAENWNQTENDWLFLINSNPEYCLVAIIKNQVIGTVTALNYQNKVAWIGMMLVSKKYRGMGISKTLLTTIIKKLKNCQSIKLDATPLGIPVYKKLGFVEEYKIDRMILTLDSNKINHKQDEKPKFTISKLLNKDIYSLAQMDEVFFGASRLELFHFLINSQNKIGFQIKNNNHFKGIVFGRKGSNHFHVGPITAYSSQFAKCLLNYVFDQIQGQQQSLVIDILSDKHELKNWLFSKKIVFQRSFTRMYLKSNDYSGKKENQFLICGPEFG